MEREPDAQPPEVERSDTAERSPEPTRRGSAPVVRRSRSTPLTVGRADDPAEHAADRTADAVVERLRSSSVLDAITDAADVEETESSGPRIRRAAPPAAGGPSAAGSEPAAPRLRRSGTGDVTVDDETTSDIERVRASGRPLDEPVRRTMEAGFGRDFSDVRVHTGGATDRLNDRLGARAFTIGSDVYFRGGMPSIDSEPGQHLIAHELAHTLEGGGTARRRSAGPVIRRKVESQDFDNQDVADYRDDVKTTLTWPTVAHLAAAARLEGIKVRLYDEGAGDDGGRTAVASELVGDGEAAPYGLLNTGDAGHWIVVVPASSSNADLTGPRYVQKGGAHDGRELRPHQIATVDDGDCGYDGIHIIKHGASSTFEQRQGYRQIALRDLDDDQVRAELVEIYELYAARPTRGMGLTPRMMAVIRALYDREHPGDDSDDDAPGATTSSATKPSSSTGSTGSGSTGSGSKGSGSTGSGSTGTQTTSAGGTKQRTGGDIRVPPPVPGAELPGHQPPKLDDATALIRAAERLKATADERGRAYSSLFADDPFLFIMGEQFRQSEREAAAALARARNPGKDDNQLQLAKAAYKVVQDHYANWARQSSKKTLVASSTSSKAHDEAMEVLKGDLDVRIAKLVPLLDQKAGRDPEHFRAVLRWLGGGDRDQLRERYRITTGDELDDALARSYGGRGSLQYLYLAEVVENGRPGPNARLALRLGLLYPRFTPFAWNIVGAVPGVADKKRLRQFMADDPASFADLTAMARTKAEVSSKKKEVKKANKQGKKDAKQSDSPMPAASAEDRFLNEAFLVLGRSGLLGEIAALGAIREVEAAAEEAGTTADVSSDLHVDYLVSLVCNTRRGQIRNLRFKPPFHVQHLRQDLVDWATNIAGKTDRGLFADAGEGVYAGKPPSSNPYTWYWESIKKLNLMTDDKALYVIAMAANKARTDSDTAANEADEGGRLGELVATLELYERKGTKVTKRLSRGGMIELTRQFLSAESTTSFDAVQAILHKYNTAGVQTVADADDRNKRAVLLEQFDIAWSKFDQLLKGVGLDHEQRGQLRQFVMLRGATGADGTAEFNIVDNYLALMAGPHRDESLRLVQALKPDTLEWHLAHRDTTLHRYLYLMHGIYDPGSRHLKWKSICAMLDISDKAPLPVAGERWDTLVGFEFDRDQMLDDDQVDQFEQSTGHSKLAKYYAGQMLAESRIDRDGNRLLEIAYEAQNAKLIGTDVGTEISRIDHSTADSLMKGKSRFRSGRGENDAYKFVGNYLRSGLVTEPPIKLEHLLNASRAITKLGTDTESRDNAMELITVDNVLEFADKAAFEELQVLSERRLDARLALFAQRQAANPDQQELDRCTELIDELTVEIDELRIGIDQTIEKRLKRVYRSGGRRDAKHRVFQLMGEAIGAGRHGKLNDVYMSEQELRFKGLQTRAATDLVEQRALQSGVSWDHRSTAAMETGEAEAMLLSTYQSHHGELQSLATKSSSSETDRKRQGELLDEFAASEKDLRTTQEYFRKLQDRLAKQTVTIVTTILSVLIAVAGLASGIGAAPGLIQLAWTIGSSVITSIVTQLLQAGLSREGEASAAEAIKASVIKLLGDIVAFSVVQELTMMIDLSLIGVHTGDAATQLFGKPALAMLKGQIGNWIGDIPEGVVNQFFKKRPITSLAPDVADAFVAKLKAMPAQMFVTYMKAFATESYRMGQKEVLEGLGWSDGVWVPDSSMAGNKAVDSDGKTTSQYDDAMKAPFLGGGSLNAQAQFALSPSGKVGAEKFFDTDDFGRDLGMAVKTVLHQEAAAAQIQQRMGSLLGQAGDVLAGNDTKATEVSGPKRKESDAAVRTTSREGQAVAILCAQFRHYGIHIDDAPDATAAKAAIRRALPDRAASSALEHTPSHDQRSVADRAVEMFDHYYPVVLAALPHTVEYDGQETYEGQLAGGERDGYGTYVWPGGESYTGNWKAGQKHGDGTYRWSNGDMYRGSWRNGNMHGQGIYLWASGASYIGTMQDDEFEGRGTYEYASGSTYVGDFVGDKFEGTGTYTSKDGWSYTGEFHDDEFHGQGTKTLEDGTQQTGQFRNGVLVDDQSSKKKQGADDGAKVEQRPKRRRDTKDDPPKVPVLA